MSIFGKIFSSSSNSNVEAVVGTEPKSLDATCYKMKMDGFKGVNRISLSKQASQTSGTHAVSLRKSAISLEKKLSNVVGGVDLSVHRAKVAVVMDKSGSMSEMYRSGIVQETLTRLMPLALAFDDNGELDVWAFHDKCYRIDSMNMKNYDTYVDNILCHAVPSWGGTRYSKPLMDIYSKYCIEEPSSYPVFVVFITDGENFETDNSATSRIIKALAQQNVFIQFVGLGNSKFSYLHTLDDMTDRECDNTGFFNTKDITQMGNEAMFDSLLDQYPAWLRDRVRITSSYSEHA